MRGGFVFVPAFPNKKILTRRNLLKNCAINNHSRLLISIRRAPTVRRDHARLAAEILLWAEPLARDRLTAFWTAAARESGAGKTLADLHWRAWRCALSSLTHGASASRRDLAALARSAGLQQDLIEGGDEAVIDEIAEVIIARFRRSPALAKDYTKALVLTAAGLLAPPAGAVRAA